MRKEFNYYNAKSFATAEDETICNQNWDNEIKLEIDEAGRYIADAEYQESSEY